MILSFSIIIPALALGGCSERYKIERMIWKAEKAAEPIFAQAGNVSDFEFDQAIGLYNNIINNTPADSKYVYTSRMRLGNLYTLKKSFDKAREIYDIIIFAHQGRPELVAPALFRKGQTYQAEGNWPGALTIFQDIIEQYPRTQEAVSIPLYIARYYVTEGDENSARQAYAKAIDHFKEMAIQYPGTKAAAMADNLAVRTYLEMQDWNGAVSFINELDNKYKLGPDTLFVLAGLYAQRLQEPEKARQLYERIIADFPDQKVTEAAKQQLDSLHNAKIPGTDS